jgi:hypothetical protein
MPSVNKNLKVGFQVLKAIAMKNSVFRIVTPNSPLKMYWHLVGTCRMFLQLATCFTLVSRFVYYSILKMEAIRSSEDSVDF